MCVLINLLIDGSKVAEQQQQQREEKTCICTQKTKNNSINTGQYQIPCIYI